MIPILGKQKGRNYWQTPPELFEKLDDEFGFDIDLAATAENSLCDVSRRDAFNSDSIRYGWGHTPWGDQYKTGFLNPPFSVTRWNKAKRKFTRHSVISKWLDAALFNIITLAQADFVPMKEIVCLLPNAQSEAWWLRYCEKSAEIRTLTPRVKYIIDNKTSKQSAPPFGSSVVIFRKKQPEAPPLRWLWKWK